MSSTKCPHCKQYLKRRPSLQAGYVAVSAPWHPASKNNGYVYEHRLVAEIKLKRPLRPGEVVHHKNGVKTDNRPSNLMVMTVAEHRRFHNLQRWHNAR